MCTALQVRDEYFDFVVNGPFSFFSDKPVCDLKEMCVTNLWISLKNVHHLCTGFSYNLFTDLVVYQGNTVLLLDSERGTPPSFHQVIKEMPDRCGAGGQETQTLQRNRREQKQGRRLIERYATWESGGVNVHFTSPSVKSLSLICSVGLSDCLNGPLKWNLLQR